MLQPAVNRNGTYFSMSKSSMILLIPASLKYIFSYTCRLWVGKLVPMTTTVKTKEIQDKGYIIVRECVPSDRLVSLRAHCAQMLEQHKQ